MADIAFREDTFGKAGLTRGKPAAKGASRWKISIDTNLDEYERASGRAIFAPAQSPEWVHAWAGNSGAAMIARIHTPDGQCALALPLEIVTASGMHIARFLGDRHANGNFPLCSYPALDRITPEMVKALLDEIRIVRPDIDVVQLERMDATRAGKSNPLVVLPHMQSPNIALAADLSGGFEALLAANGGNSRLKRHRQQLRKFSKAGEVKLIRASTHEEVDRLFDAFLEMKAARFAGQGIDNPFAAREVADSFRNLFHDALKAQVRLFTLEALEIGGKLRAVTGHSHDGNRIICEFCAFAQDELSPYSPGSYLYFELIRQAAADGYRFYDFSVGDEPYKRLWSNVEIEQFDVIVPLTLKGTIGAVALRTASALKRGIKSQPLVWQQVKNVRQRVRGAA